MGDARKLHGFARTMNSLNILSARVIGQTPPNTPSTIARQRSFSEGNLSKGITDRQPKRSASQHTKSDAEDVVSEKEAPSDGDQADRNGGLAPTQGQEDEKTLLLEGTKPAPGSYPKRSKLHLVAKRLVHALSESLKWVLSTLIAPGVYVVTCFYNDEGKFSPFLPIRKFGGSLRKRNGTKATTQAVGISGLSELRDQNVTAMTDNHNFRRKSITKLARRRPQPAESFSSATSDSELESSERSRPNNIQSGDKAKSETQTSATLARRSIRIKLYNEDSNRRRKEKRVQNASSTDGDRTSSKPNKQPTLTAATLKSPTSPASSSMRMTKYPRALDPPRPLIPQFQPSYSTQPSQGSNSRLAQKTLVIDLDETLIHSLAKGGRMSSGHMVEVKLNTTVGFGGATLGPQHPILYYVHKRPHCDKFLRKVCDWYNLVVFTASVQEYADPVIDWLEQERKYFSGRYYRQHCTFRNGAYIKDLSSVEPDLSKVMILDNSPLSYIFHEGRTPPDVFSK